MMPQPEFLSAPLSVDVPAGCAVGNDLVYLPAFRENFNALFKKRVYTAREIAYCDAFADPVLRYASTFAAKEAVYKAVKQLQSPVKLGWRKIEILREKPAGMPTVEVHAATVVAHIGLTLTHDGDYVWAIAVAR